MRCDFLTQQFNFTAQTEKLLSDGVIVMNLVKLGRTLSCNAHYLCRNTDSCGIGRHLTENDSTCGNSCIISDGEGTEHLCACSDEDISAEGRMTFALVLTCTAEGDSLIDHAAVADNCSLTDNNTGAVVYHDTSADSCAGVYLDTCTAGCALTYPAGEQPEAVVVQPVCSAV